MTINEFLQSLKPSGEGSFEDLIGELLGTLTGLRFYAARSGDQGGRDGRAAASAVGDIVFECKKYSGDTALRDRELIGELAQAYLRLPQLDLWIIAASREVTDQNVSSLEAFGKQHAIDILSLESLEDGSGNLDSVVAAFPAVTERFAKPSQLTDLRKAICQLARRPDAQTLLDNLKKRFHRPDAGWPSWRQSSHQEWNRIVNQEAVSRSCFGQPLDVSSGGSIPRTSAETALDNWWQNHPSKLFAMTGEEGDGKSWSVAQWLTNQIQKSRETFPPVVFIPSRDAGPAKLLQDLVLENVRRLLPTGDWLSKLHRWLDYRDADANEPVAVVVLDGLNERHSPDYWQTVIESSFDKPWVGKIRLICTSFRKNSERYCVSPDISTSPQNTVNSSRCRAISPWRGCTSKIGVTVATATIQESPRTHSTTSCGKSPNSTEMEFNASQEATSSSTSASMQILAALSETSQLAVCLRKMASAGK